MKEYRLQFRSDNGAFADRALRAALDVVPSIWRGTWEAEHVQTMHGPAIVWRVLISGDWAVHLATVPSWLEPFNVVSPLSRSRGSVVWHALANWIAHETGRETWALAGGSRWHNGEAKEARPLLD